MYMWICQDLGTVYSQESCVAEKQRPYFPNEVPNLRGKWNPGFPFSRGSPKLFETGSLTESTMHGPCLATDSLMCSYAVIISRT